MPLPASQRTSLFNGKYHFFSKYKERKVLIRDVNREAPQVDVKREVKYLGVIKANPAEYVQRYGATLKLAKDLPDFVVEVNTRLLYLNRLNS